MTKKILLTGATGYIGGTVLARVLTDIKDAEVTVLVRSAEQAKKYESTLPVKVLLGSYDEPEKLKEASAEFDIVIDTASADHPVGAQAIVDGLRIRSKKTGQRPILVHTSGTGVLLDLDNFLPGETTDFVYDDEKPEDFANLPANRLHRNVDVIVESGSDDIDVITIVPPTIWGVGEGLFSTRSIQIPFIIKAALKNKQAYQIGNGKNIWHHVNVSDLADFYVHILKLALEKKAPTGKNGYYFAEADQFEYGTIASAVAKKLKELNIGDGSVKNASASEAKTIFPDLGYDAATLVGLNSRGKANKGRRLGWTPKNTDLYKAVAEETEFYAKQQ